MDYLILGSYVSAKLLFLALTIFLEIRSDQSFYFFVECVTLLSVMLVVMMIDTKLVEFSCVCSVIYQEVFSLNNK